MATFFNRREFGALALAAPRYLKASESQPTTTFPHDPRHRLSVSTYPFRSVITLPQDSAPGNPADTAKQKMSLSQFAGTVVDQFGVYGIEPWSHHFESIEPAHVHDLSRAFQKARLKVVNIPCDVRVRLCGTSEERESALETYRKWVDGAIILGSPSIRVHVPRTEKPDDLSCAIDGLKALADYGAQKDIVINLENDSPSTEAPERVLKVIEGVNSPFLRSLPDFCNSMQIHDDQNYNAHAMESLFPHAFNISHVKDLEIVNGKSLRVDVDRIFAIAKKAGYKGYFSMETEGSEDPYAGTKRLIEACLRNLTA